MTHPFPQLPEIGACRRGEIVAGMPKVMKVNLREPRSGAGPMSDPAPEVAVMQRRASGTSEDQRVIARGNEPHQMPHRRLQNAANKISARKRGWIASASAKT
jgi:hypothetical protein